MRIRKIIPGVDAKRLIKDAGKLMPDPLRRNFLRGAASLGALTFLTGCDIIDGDTAEGVLRKISEFNDGVQPDVLYLFNETRGVGVTSCETGKFKRRLHANDTYCVPRGWVLWQV